MGIRFTKERATIYCPFPCCCAEQDTITGRGAHSIQISQWAVGGNGCAVDWRLLIHRISYFHWIFRSFHTVLFLILYRSVRARIQMLGYCFYVCKRWWWNKKQWFLFTYFKLNTSIHACLRELDIFIWFWTPYTGIRIYIIGMLGLV